MKINYIYSFQDYEAIHRSRRKARKFAVIRDWALYLLIGFNFAIGIWFIGLALQKGRSLELFQFGNIAIGILLVIGIFVLGPLYRKWYLRQQMVEGKNVSLEIDESGLFAVLGDNETKTHWQGVFRADEDKSHFTLWINKLQAYSIPKKVMDDNIEMAVRQLIVANVENRTLINE